jgi:ATP-binding cassette subfamily B protein
MFKLLLKMNKKEWLLMLVAAILIGAGVWLDLRIPEYTQDILTIATPDPMNLSDKGIPDIWIAGAWMIGLTLVSVATVVVVGYIMAKVSSSLSSRIRTKVFDKVGDCSMAEIKKFSVPSLITRSTNDITQVRMFFAMGLQLLVRAPLTAIQAIFKITNRSWDLSMVTTAAVGVVLIFVLFMLFMVMPRFKRIQKLTDNVTQVARDNLTGIRVVRAYNAEPYEEHRFEGVNQKLTKNNLFAMRSFALLQPFMTLLMTGLGLAIWYFGATIVHAWDMSTPIGAAEAREFALGLPTFMTYSVQIVMSFMMLIMVFIMLPRASISAQRINEVLATKPTIVGGTKDETEGTGDGSIVFKDVCFKYPDAAEYVLKDIDLTIRRGETVAFIGSTGSGKSTLVNLLPRIYDATDGQILLEGIDVKEYNLDALHDKIGYIPQTAVLFRGTIRSNIDFGSSKGITLSDDAIWKALEIAQAADFVRELPEGLDAEVAQGGKNFSGGQKQRLSIARVVARNPEVYIFDDTFSALDYKTDRNLRIALNSATKDATKLIVAQRIGTIKEADQIIVLENGVAVGKGTHKELMKNCNVYQEIAYSQLSKEELK